MRPPLGWTSRLVVTGAAFGLACLSMPELGHGRAVARCEGAAVERSRGVARQLSECGRVDTTGGPAAAALRALSGTAPALGLRGDGRDLRLFKAESLPIGDVVRFRQVVDGVPVRFAQVVVSLGDGGAIDFVGSSAVPGLAPRTTRAAVSRARAHEIARARVPGGTLASPLAAELVIAPLPGGDAVAAWDTVVSTVAPAHEWRVLVHAGSGEVLDLADELRHVDGSGQVYAPNPVQSSGVTTLTDSSDAASPALNGARASVTLSDLGNATSKLTGTYADMTAPGVVGCTLPYAPGLASEATRVYGYTRDDDRFEEATTYHAITATARKYQSLGFTTVMDRPMPVDVHCVPDDNSFYSAQDKALHMGDGGVDDAEDADITIHEYGHATQDDQVPGIGPGQHTEQRAMGEGFGDVLAMLMYVDKGNATYQGTGAAGRRFCVGEWDAASYNPVVAGNSGSGCLRWTDGRSEGDGGAIGNFSGTAVQEHDDGRYWSAAVTCIFRGMETAGATTATARDDTLRLLLGHHALLTPTAANTGFDDSVNALLSVDRTLFSGAHLALIESCTEARLAVPVDLDVTPPVVASALTPTVPDGTNGWYRQDVSVDWTVTEAQPYETVGCTDTTISADTTSVDLHCTATSEGGMTSRTVSIRRDATPPVLAPSLAPASPAVGQQATVTANATDATSGVAAFSCEPADTSSAGTKRLECTATDHAGNVATAPLDYSVTEPGATPTATATPAPTVTPVPTATPTPPLAAKPNLTTGKLVVTRDGRLKIEVTPSRTMSVTGRISLGAGQALRMKATSLTTGRPRSLTFTGTRKARRRLLSSRKRRRVSLTVVFTVKGIEGTLKKKVVVPRSKA